MAEMSMADLASKFAKASKSVSPLVDQKLRTTAQVAVGYVKSEIQDMHAVDTGTMLNSTQAERDSATSYLIGPTVSYAPYVALGTSRMAARPFHIEAARKLQADINKGLFSAEDLGL
jgi:hypothetical protein